MPDEQSASRQVPSKKSTKTKTKRVTPPHDSIYTMDNYVLNLGYPYFWALERNKGMIDREALESLLNRHGTSKDGFSSVTNELTKAITAGVKITMPDGTIKEFPKGMTVKEYRVFKKLIKIVSQKVKGKTVKKVLTLGGRKREETDLRDNMSEEELRILRYGEEILAKLIKDNHSWGTSENMNLARIAGIRARRRFIAENKGIPFISPMNKEDMMNTWQNSLS